MKERIQNIYHELESGFAGFWVKKHRVSFLLIFLLVFSGLFSLYTIPKESSPDIKFGIISIVTNYIGVNPNDIDALITDKIENEIENIEGIKKINSTSYVGVSSIVVELYNNANTREVMDDIESAVDRVSLPSDADDPSIIELSSNNELMFEALLYSQDPEVSSFELQQKAQQIKSELSSLPSIASINVGGVDFQGFAPSQTDGEYEIQVHIDRSKLEQLGISLVQLSNIIRSYNKNTPIGNYEIDTLNYDFRFQGEISSLYELQDIVIRSNGSSHLRLGDISTIKKSYNDDTIRRIGFQDKNGFPYVPLAFNKKPGDNIFKTSGAAKQALEDMIDSTPGFESFGVRYSKDLSSIIIDDYNNLGKTALQTLVFVFITILFFVGLRESIIASTLLPLAFFVTFIVLDNIGFSLNFMTNFSLVLTLGIAIDTVIVIIEGASEKMRLGYSKKYAVLLAIRDYRSPLISGTMTTLVAFIPLIFLPGVLGRFLAYIPVTVFTTLLGALILSLTVSSALFAKFMKEPKVFKRDPKLEDSFSEEQKAFLEQERSQKKEVTHESLSLRAKFLDGLGEHYYHLLSKVVSKRKSRYAFILTPILLLGITLFTIVPQIGFILFPQTDNNVINIDITARDGRSEKSLLPYIKRIDETLRGLPELKVYYTTIESNKLSVYVDLLELTTRKEQGGRSIFELEDYIIQSLSDLESEGLFVSISALREGPPTGKAVGVKLQANNSKWVAELEETAKIFEEHLKTIKGVKNVQTSSTQTPGQFVFEFKKQKLSYLGLLPSDILNELYTYINGVKAGSIKSEYEDNTIRLLLNDFTSEVTPSDIENILIPTKAGKIRIGDVASYKFTDSVSSISRVDGDISITVDADITGDYLPSDIQPLLEKYAKDYIYPSGISYKTGGETQENKDLIISIIRSLFITLFLIFGILVFQFNSFLQPLIVLYSVILATLGVNVGLFLTGNPFSITFMIGFVALVGVVVNDAIILIDRINKNLAKGIDSIHSVIAAGKIRLQPIIVTTLTTMFGILPLALQDQFWSGLGFTIIFGLFAGSTMTLFVIPCLYFELFLRKKK